MSRGRWVSPWVVCAFVAALFVATPAQAGTILSPPDESLAYGANPSRTGQASETTVFGPLRQDWKRNLNGVLGQALVVDGRVIVSLVRQDRTGSVTALDPDTGRTIWQRPMGTGAFSIPLGAESGIVVALSHFAGGSMLTGLSSADGSQIWSRTIFEEGSFESSPVVDSGFVYTYVGGVGDEGELRAFVAATGQELGALSPGGGLSGAFYPANLEPEAQGLNPALDESRVFVAGDDEGAAAVDRGSGMTAWTSYGDEDELGCEAGTPLVAGARVLTSGGCAFDAADGGQVPTSDLSRANIEAAAFGLAYDADSETVRAFGIEPGSTSGWSSRNPFSDDVAGLVVSPRALFLSTSSGVASYGPQRGGVLWQQGLSSFISDSRFGNATLAANHLFLGAGGRLTALSPILLPPGRGIAVAASAFDVIAGKRVEIVAGVGEALWSEGAAIEARRDAAPFGRFKAIPAVTREDGSTVVDTRIDRSTRYRFASGDASATAIIRAYAKLDILDVRAVSPTRGVIVGRIEKVLSKAVQGLKMHAYFGSASKRTYTRLGSARLRRSGSSAAEAEIGFRLLKRVGGKDVVAICVEGLPEAGYGVNTGFQKQCGERRIPYPKRKGDGKSRSDRPPAPAMDLAPALSR